MLLIANIDIGLDFGEQVSYDIYINHDFFATT